MGSKKYRNRERKQGKQRESERREEFSLKELWRAEKGTFGLLTLVGLLLYGWFINNAFVSDDIYGIVNNPAIASWQTVVANPFAFLRPLMYFVTYHLFGQAPWAFRTWNISTHILMGWAVFGLVTIITNKKAARLAALLVLVHPLMVESVTWISGGAHNQYSLMLVFAMGCYILGRRENKPKYVWGGSGFFLLALLFSEKAFTFPLILLLWELMFERGKRRLTDLIPYFVLSGIWVLKFAGAVEVRVDNLTRAYSSSSEMLDWFVQIPVAITEYLKLTIWPMALTLYHSDYYLTPTTLLIRQALTGGLAVVGVVVAILGYRKGGVVAKLAFFGGWFLFGLALTLNPWIRSWIVAERYVYFSLSGLLIGVAILWEEWVRGKKWEKTGWIVVWMIVALLGVRTLVRNFDWRNQDYLWLSAEKTSPSSPQNHNNLGDLYGRKGEFELAKTHFEQAIALNPDYADAYHNLGNTYLSMKKPGEARINYQKALENNPNLWQSHEQLAALNYQEGKIAEAIGQMQKALEIMPQSDWLHAELALLWGRVGEKEKAQQEVEIALQLNPDNEMARGLSVELAK